MAGIPQVITEDRASGAQVIDGCLRFDTTKGQYLKFTPSSSGNRRTQTLSVWIKNTYNGTDNKVILGGGDNASGPRHNIYYTPTKRFGITQNPTGSSNDAAASVAQFRDFSGWQHLVFALDCTLGQESSQVRIWVNGEIQSNGDYAGGGSPSYITNQDGIFNTISKRMYLGHYAANPSDPAEFDGYMAQYHWIDGLALGPSYFGYSDPLTGVWRPKKFRAEGTTVNDGTEWTTKMSNTSLVYAGAASNVYNGVVYPWTTDNYVSYNVGTLTLLTGVNIEVKHSIRIFGNWGYGDYIVINGVNYLNDANGSQKWITPIGVTYPLTLTTLALDSTPTNIQNSLSAIEIDGVIMKDSTTQNLDFGTNGVYLPFDGSAPIGQDQSGKGNDYTPVNFGGSVLPENSIVSGAKPIRNNLGGTVAKSGVFGSNVGATYKTTSLTNSTGKYYFAHDSGTAAPSFNFIRGATYVFDNTIGSTHTLRLSTTSNGTWGGGSVYTDGVETFGNFTVITVPHDAPNTLYYFCTVHTGMGGSINVTTDETKADKYASSLVLACPYAGDKEDVSNQINCTVSSKGSDNYGSVQRYKNGSFYTSSRFFDGSNDNINYSSSSTLGFDGAFTIEMYASPDDSSNDGGPLSSKGYYSANTGNWYLRFSATSGGKISFYSYQGTSSGQENGYSNTGATNTNRMYHIVCQRNSSNLMTFMIDGVIVGQGSNVTRNLDDGASNGITVGRIASGNSSNSAHIWYGGSISDLRIYKGIDKYDVSGKSVGDQVFIPASSNPDILPDSPSGLPFKSDLKKIADGGVSINRTSDQYLQTPASTDFRLDGQYCIEYFLNLTDYSNDTVYVRTFVLDGPTGDGGSTNIHLNINPDTGKILLWSGSGELIGGTISVAGGWHHVCLTRDSSNVTRLFVDGVLSGSATITTDYNLNSNQNRPRLGALGSTGGTTGHYSNWRITKGSIPFDYQTASTTTGKRYFVPPTEPLTTSSQGATANDVKLLCCQSNSQAGDATTAPSMGGLNNGTQWSAFLSSPDDSDGSESYKLFDGDTSVLYSPGASTITFDITSIGGITVSTSLEVYYSSGAASRDFSVNGGSTVASGTGTKWVDLGFTGTFNTLTGTNGGQIGAIRIDGTTILTDPVRPVGNAAATIFNPFTTDINTVRGQEGAYCTINPLGPGSLTLSNGNLTYTRGTTDWESLLGTLPMTSGGKWYYEIFLDNAETGNNNAIVEFGFATRNFTQYANYLGTDTESWAYQNNGSTYGQAFHNNAQITNYGVNAATGDTLALTLDLSAGGSNGVLTFYKNGVSMGTAYTNIDCTRDYFPAFSAYAAGKATCNFGQKPFKFQPPDGFQPLTSSTARPDTVIPRPDQYVKTVLYTGTGAEKILDVGFQPDFSYFSIRNGTGYIKYWFDSVRGATKYLATSETQSSNAEGTDAQTLKSFNSNGVTIGTNSQMNESSSNTWASWHWKAGGNAGTFNKDDVAYVSAAAAGLTAGDTAATGSSVGTKQGFSIVSYTGAGGSTAEIPHGLEQSPNFVIIKNRDGGSSGSAGGWYCIYHDDFPNKSFLGFNTTAPNDGVWNNHGKVTGTTSTVVQVADGDEGTPRWWTHNSGSDYIMYSWHNVPGLQKFGSYTGNLNADGPFIDLGFRPALIWLKERENAGNWWIYDSERSQINPTANILWMNRNLAENHTDIMSDTTSNNMDMLSNGFKLRSNKTGTNRSGGTYIYCAWAEAPTFNLYGAQSNAR